MIIRLKIYLLDDDRYEVYVYQLGIQNIWANSLTAAKRNALLDT